MKLAINGRFLTQDTTGVQRYAIELTKALDSILPSRSDIEVTLIAPNDARQLPLKNITFRRAGLLKGHLWEQLELPFLARGQTLFCPGNTAPIVSLLGSPTVVTVHDLSFRYFPSAYSLPFRLWYGAITPLVMKFADKIITVSDTERLSILSHYPDSSARMHAVANGGLPADVAHRAPQIQTLEMSGFVLYVGSLSKRKGFPLILETARRLGRKRGLQFVIIGGAAGGIVDAGQPPCSELASALRFTGQINDADMIAEYYRQAACLLFPSHYESSGLPPIEAMACGCPVIVSDIPALRERCGNSALYCDPNDIDSVVAAVERIFDDPGLRNDLRQSGLKRAALFTWERCAAETLDIIASCGTGSAKDRQ